MENTRIIKIKRAYEPEYPDDGFRVYVDRLWPRGLSHENFHYDLWEKDVAPSTELREWFHADPENRWDEFKRKYEEELKENPAVKSLLETIAGKPTVTLIYSSQDAIHNNAAVLRDFIKKI